MRGSIFWVRLEGLRRPAIVLSPDSRNRHAPDVIVVPCATGLSQLAWHVLLKKGEGGLPGDSMVSCERIATVRKENLLPQPLGEPLSPTRMREIEKAVISALGIVQ